VFLKPGNNEGDNTSIIRYEPDIPYLNSVNKTVTAKEGTGDNVIIFGAPFEDTRTLSGYVALGKNEFELKGSLPDPPYFCAYTFCNYLRNKNIQITELPNTVRNIKLQKKYIQQEHTLIASHSSPVLNKIAYNTNTYSNNTFAEALLKTIGYFRNNEGSTISGARAVKDFWKSKKVDTGGLIMNDGSGLSPTNRINAMQIIQMLDYIYNDNIIKDNFYSSLPIAGVSGSIKDNFKNSAAENKLRAKSGYMNGVRSYAGYVRNKNGEMIAFSILINNYLGTPKDLKDNLEKIMTSIAEMQ
jgi:D-alanyl-D-alanine carboxypeptidase/D-alanyl-D-alanine-endopeptidase (penicillin-binding protein 4)